MRQEFVHFGQTTQRPNGARFRTAQLTNGAQSRTARTDRRRQVPNGAEFRTPLNSEQREIPNGAESQTAKTAKTAKTAVDGGRRRTGAPRQNGDERNTSVAHGMRIGAKVATWHTAISMSSTPPSARRISSTT
jgi:hypothetical protein